jgi:ribonuclease HI
MPADRPHFLLLAEATCSADDERQWQFALEPVEGGDRITANDVESKVSCDRLELLAAVRGLEALEQPSRVTLLTCSLYVRRGINHDLGRWRESHWRWERFGRLVPIRDQDLWQRLDRALAIHDVACCPVANVAEEPAVATYGIACAGAIEPRFEPTLVIVRRKQGPTRRVLRRPNKPARPKFATLNQKAAERWSGPARPELSRTA